MMSNSMGVSHVWRTAAADIEIRRNLQSWESQGEEQPPVWCHTVCDRLEQCIHHHREGINTSWGKEEAHIVLEKIQPRYAWLNTNSCEISWFWHSYFLLYPSCSLPFCFSLCSPEVVTSHLPKFPLNQPKFLAELFPLFTLLTGKLSHQGIFKSSTLPCQEPNSALDEESSYTKYKQMKTGQAMI